MPSLPLTGSTKGPEYPVTRNFSISVQADMDFRHRLSPYGFNDQVVTSCMGLIVKGPLFTFTHKEFGGRASFALLNQRIQIWCASTSSSGTCSFERCCPSSDGFIELMQPGPREREARYLQFTSQRPGGWIYIPNFLAHAVLTLDTGSSTILSGWDAATSIQQIIIQTLDEFTFGLPRAQGREILLEKSLSALRE